MSPPHESPKLCVVTAASAAAASSLVVAASTCTATLTMLCSARMATLLGGKVTWTDSNMIGSVKETLRGHIRQAPISQALYPSPPPPWHLKSLPPQTTWLCTLLVSGGNPRVLNPSLSVEVMPFTAASSEEEGSLYKETCQERLTTELKRGGGPAKEPIADKHEEKHDSLSVFLPRSTIVTTASQRCCC